MNDNSVLIIISVIVLLAIGTTVKYSKVFFAVNLIVFCAYTTVMYWGLYYDVSDGKALAWWFYLLVVSVLQLLVVTAYLVKRIFRKQQ